MSFRPASKGWMSYPKPILSIEERLRHADVERRRDLDVPRVPVHGAHGDAGPLDEHGLVRPVETVVARRVVGLLQDGVEKALGRLDAEKRRPVDGLDDGALADLLDRVDERDDRDRGA